MTKLYKSKPFYIKAVAFKLGMEDRISRSGEYFVKGVHDNFDLVRVGDYIVTYHDGDQEIFSPQRFKSEFTELCNDGREYADHAMGASLTCIDCGASEADLANLKDLDNLK